MKVLRDTWLIFRHETMVMSKNPGLIALTLAQPLAYLYFFAPFLKVALANQGLGTYGQAYAVYVPGLFVAMGLLGGLSAGYGLLNSLRQGVIDRCRVTPVSRTGLLLGRALMHVALMEFQAVTITLAALPFGLRVDIGDALLAYLLLSLVMLLSITISYGIALVVRNENSLGILINTVGQPVSLLAGILIPLSLAPLWVQNVALWNPFAWATDGLRALFTGHLTDDVVWQGATIMVVTCAISVAWAIRLFNREVS